MQRIILALVLTAVRRRPGRCPGSPQFAGHPARATPARRRVPRVVRRRAPWTATQADELPRRRTYRRPDRRARVIYGSEGVRAGQAPQPRAIPRAIPRRVPSDSQPYPNGRQVYRSVALDTGYQDGYDKGREDARDNDRYDPARHGRFRSADRGYERRYGSKVEYQRTYRDGFRAGYDEGYRDYDRISRNGRRPELRIPWPF